VKKILAIALAVIAILALSLPAAADSIDTGVVVSNAEGAPPVVKAMWEHDAGPASAVASESGDPSHLTLGVQIAPNIGFQATKQITFAAIVTDERGVDNITHVYADVYELDNTTLKFEVELTRHGTDDFMKSLFDQAAAAGPTGANTPNGTIVGMTSINTNAVDPSYNVPITKADIDTELDQQLAAKYWGTWQFDNCQLAGRYRVVIHAFNVQAKVGSFEGWIDWSAVTAAAFDFTTMNYGNATLGVHKQIGGDRVFGGNLRTIENVGNTYLKMTVKQDDMGLGSTMINGVSTWNVHYDFRLGDGDIPAAANPAFVNYDPAVAKGGNLAGASSVSSLQILKLCAVEKVDFSIQVDKDLTAGTPKTGTMIIGAAKSAYDANAMVGQVYPYGTGTPQPTPQS
jgi:hypothetical protein